MHGVVSDKDPPYSEKVDVMDEKRIFRQNSEI
jgi:hypothetical protein